jgi:hypothetical protein
MTVTELNRAHYSETDVFDKEYAKELLLEEAELRVKLAIDGIRYTTDEIKPYQNPSSRPFRQDRREGEGLGSFFLPHGFNASARYQRWSPFSLVVEDNKPILYDDETRIGEVTFLKADPAVENLKNQRLSTGEKFSDIASVSAEGGIGVGYSSECSLQDAGEACLFCGIAAEGREPIPGRPTIKTPTQVAEAYHLARQAGLANHFRITGGFVPERRELEYYLDVADTIKERYSDFNGVAIIGAPADLSIIDKYKEAGYTHISHNIEVWDKNIFKAICPGKDKRNGGWQQWVDALEYSAQVFGKGHVHSNLVAGLAPKQSTLEGIEYLASKGVVCNFESFTPRPGTQLEGYRTPEASWHWDLLLKVVDIFRRYGFETYQIYSGPASGPRIGPTFRVATGDFIGNRLDQWKFPALD